MTANVSITAVDRQDVLLVPAVALERQRRERFVRLKKPDGQAEQRKVETGATDGESVEVLSGLAEGDTVLLPAAGEGGGWRRDGQGDQARRDAMRTRMMMGAPGGAGGGPRR
jgi:multidrug efflux pump subunit AcrA (membrane-fusion protein)